MANLGFVLLILGAFLSCLLAVRALNEANSHMVVSAQGYRDVDAPAEY